MKFPMPALIESLESRIAPAGIVNVSYINGVLTITGDHEGSSLSLQNTGEGTLVLEALDGTTLVRTDGAGESFVFDESLQSLNWVGGSGNDELYLDGIQADGDIVLDGGGGENRIELGAIHSEGNLVINNHGSVDRLEIGSSIIDLAGDFRVNGNIDGYNMLNGDDSILRVGGSLVFQGGDGFGGNDSFYLEATELSVDKDIFVKCGNGENQAYMYLQTLDVGGNVTLLNGDHDGLTGGSLIDVRFGYIGGNVTMAEGIGDSGNGLSFEHLKIDGDLTISHPFGNASVGLGDYVESGDVSTSKLFVGGNLQVDLADGPNTFYSNLSTLQVDGKLTINGGNSDDSVSFHGNLISVGNSWSIDLHDGTNSTDIVSETISIHKFLTVGGGSGVDSLSISGEALTINKSLVVDMGEGSGSVSVTSSYLYVGGTAQVASDTHSGEDFMTKLGSERLAVKRGIDIHNGDGINQTVIESITALNVSGGLAVQGGSGDDSLMVNVNGTIKGNVKFAGSSGTNHFEVLGDDMLPRNLAVKGSVLVSSTGDTEVISTGIYRVTDDFRIALGTGASHVQINPFSRLYVNGAMKISGGDTISDLVEIQNLWVRGGTNLQLGAGESSVKIVDSDFRKFRLDTGAGNDSVEIEHESFDYPTTFRGVTAILLGDGDDHLVIGSEAEFDKGKFLAPVVINGGTGVNTANDIEGLNLFGPAATLTLIGF